MPRVVRPNGISFGDGTYIFTAPGDPNARVGDDTGGSAG